jgi:GT2 family glycosyltransferase
MKEPIVSAIILNWESPEDVVQCVESIQNQSYPDLRPIVIDNGSNDGSPEYLSDELSCPVHCLDQNLGFAGGMNKGAEFASCENPDYLWLLNPDIDLPNNDTLETLVRDLESNDNFGVVSPLIRKENGEFWFERGEVDFSTGTIEHKPLKSNSERFVKCGYVPMTAALIDYSLYSALDGLPELYFLYYEDVDLCTQVRIHNTEIVVDSDTTIVHEVSGSSNGEGNSPTKSYYRTRNHLLFISRYKDYISRYELAFLRRLARESAINFYRGNFDCVNAIVKGLKDGIRNQHGKGPYP